MRQRVLTLYLTRDVSTFNLENFRSVCNQVFVKQDIYVVSADPIRLEGLALPVRNLVVPVKSTWPVQIRVAYSFNVALLLLRKRGISLEDFDYIFKVDGDVRLPEDYLYNLISQKPLAGGFGAALLMSTKFFKHILGGRYPINYCDDGYIIAYAIALSGWIANYTGKGSIEIPLVATIPEREFVYGIEYYRWGLPIPILILLPISRIYLKITKRMKKHQVKPIRSYAYNFAGYLRAALLNIKKYEFHRNYKIMRLWNLYYKIIGKYFKV